MLFRGRLARTLIGLVAFQATTWATPAMADDPLDGVDGTEGWEDIDTSAVDEATAWRRWRADLRRWEAGQSRIEAERERMARLRERRGHEGDDPTTPPEVAEGADPQARIDAARRSSRSGGPDRRDSQGQTLDDERPWSRR